MQLLDAINTSRHRLHAAVAAGDALLNVDVC
jgi:hypothetical protein